MARTKSIPDSIKYTIVIPEADVNQLKELADEKVIGSVNAGIREAVADYIARIKKEQYKQALLDAVRDDDFIKRTDDSMEAFETSDKETGEMIPEW